MASVTMDKKVPEIKDAASPSNERYIIAISGKRYSGKTYISNKFREYYDVICLPIGDLLKSDYCEYKTISPDQLNYRQNKETYREDLIKYDSIQKAIYGESHWIDMLLTSITSISNIRNSTTPIIIPDVRRQYEYIAIQDYCRDNGYIFKSIRINITDDIKTTRGWKRKPVDDHISETDLDDYPFNVCYNNLYNISKKTIQYMYKALNINI